MCYSRPDKTPLVNFSFSGNLRLWRFRPCLTFDGEAAAIKQAKAHLHDSMQFLCMGGAEGDRYHAQLGYTGSTHPLITECPALQRGGASEV
jgi:hypothetical protein